MVAKISMLLALADGKGPAILLPHVSVAIKLLKSVENNLPDLIDFSQHEPSTEKTLKVREAIKRHQKIDRSRLLRNLSRSVSGPELTRAIVDLKDQQLITEDCSPTGARIYIWLGNS